jgi:hypothetical protein
VRGPGFELWYGRRQRLNPARGKGAMSSDAAGDCLQLSPAENPLPHCVLQHRARERASGSRWTPRWREMDFELFGSWSRDRQTVIGDGTAVSKTGADLLGEPKVRILLPPAASHVRTKIFRYKTDQPGCLWHRRYANLSSLMAPTFWLTSAKILSPPSL